ncbi:MAG: hypothetical protein AMXMBFR53_04840 [Gemmatimonadota bacterium]
MAELLAAAGAKADAQGVAAAELEARRALHAALDQGVADTEPTVWRDYFGAIFRGAGVPDAGMEEAGRLLREVHAHDHLWTHVAEGTHEALTALAGAGYRLGVISNADGRVEGVLEEVGLRRHFEFVVDSELFGAEKPDPSIFLEGCRRMGLPPAACLYVGDLYPVDYLGATRAGLGAVLLDPLGLHEGRAPRVAALGELEAFLANGDARGAAVSTHG